jgi:hypothetical protein
MMSITTASVLLLLLRLLLFLLRFMLFLEAGFAIKLVPAPKQTTFILKSEKKQGASTTKFRKATLYETTNDKPMELKPFRPAPTLLTFPNCCSRATETTREKKKHQKKKRKNKSVKFARFFPLVVREKQQRNKTATGRGLGEGLFFFGGGGGERS